MSGSRGTVTDAGRRTGMKNPDPYGGPAGGRARARGPTPALPRRRCVAVEASSSYFLMDKKRITYRASEVDRMNTVKWGGRVGNVMGGGAFFSWARY